MNKELRIKNGKFSIKAIIHDSLFMIRKSTGFTLIELLVVITIIGILAALLMSNFVGIRQRARDGQRKSNLRQIQGALELYRANKGDYPEEISCGQPLTDGVNNYMQKIPCDPLQEEAYTYSKSGATYTLVACLENGNDGELPDPPVVCSSDASRWEYTLKNP